MHMILSILKGYICVQEVNNLLGIDISIYFLNFHALWKLLTYPTAISYAMTGTGRKPVESHSCWRADGVHGFMHACDIIFF